MQTSADRLRSGDSTAIKHRVNLIYGVLQINMISSGDALEIALTRNVSKLTFFPLNLIPIKHFLLI